MNADSVVFVAYGAALLVFGVGLLFVDLGPAAYRKDDARYGPLSKLGIGMIYAVVRTRTIKTWLAFLAIVSGIAIIVYPGVHP